MRSLTISIIIKTPLVRFGDLDEIEVALLASLAGSGICLDPMRVDHDPALGRLSKHLSETRDRKPAGGNDIGQHLPRTKGRQPALPWLGTVPCPLR
jgi:hypothetical protein